MAKYAQKLVRSGGNNVQSFGTITASSGTAVRRGKLIDVMFGFDASTPVDTAYTLEVQRCTTTGTGTTVTPAPLDPADAAFLGVAKSVITADPTLTASTILMSLPVNGRTSYRWIANTGEELIYPATNANGLSMDLSAASTVTGICTSIFEEQ